MKLNSLVKLFKGGNAALATKLNNLLTEDCQILEYTDDAVLFIKNEKLVLATYAHSLNESALSSENILDNEVITIVEADTKEELTAKLKEVVSNLAEENYVDAEDSLESFCEDFKIYSYLKLRYPAIFVESRIKNTRGFDIRKKAVSLVPKFKAAVFSSVLMNESKTTSLDLSRAVSILEKYGMVLTLGKVKVTAIVEDALLNNTNLAKTITESLFETYKELKEANEELQNTEADGYDVEGGQFPDELGADLDAPEEGLDPVAPSGEEESATEFMPLDPSKLSEEDLKQLHKDTLRSVITSIKDFVVSKSNDPGDSQISPDSEEKISGDLEKLEDPAISDEELAEIEGRWSPVLSYFLDSDTHKPDEDMEDTGVDATDEDADSGNEMTEAEPPVDPTADASVPPPPGGPAIPEPQV